MQQVHIQATKNKEGAEPRTKQQPLLEQQLLSLYEQRFKSLMATIKIYQETLLKDNEEGGLSFMNGPELATYRIDRENQLLKDILLTEKQRLVIKALTSYHQIKKQNDYLKAQSASSSVKNPYNKGQGQMAAEKDVLLNNNRTSIDKESRISSKAGETYCNITANQFMSNKTQNSNSRITIVSQQGNNQGSNNHYNTNGLSPSISVYQRLLQEKLTMIKQLQKKNRQLSLENEQQMHKISQLQMNLQKYLKQEMMGRKECEECMRLRELNVEMSKRVEMMKQENQGNKIRIKQQEGRIRVLEGEGNVKQLKVEQLMLRVQSLQRELSSVRGEEQHSKQQSQKQQQQNNNKQSLPNNNANNNKSQLITQLKQKLLIQQQQLMHLTNSFELLKEQITQSLLSQIQRLKKSHILLKQQIKSIVMGMKKEMMNWMNEIVERMRIKSDGVRGSEEIGKIGKKLRQIDNQLDYFIEQRKIKV